MKKDATKSFQNLGGEAARQFNTLASEYLLSRSIPSSGDAIAKIVGEMRQAYFNARKGITSISLDRVAAWITRWEAAGHPAMMLSAGSSGVTVAFRDDVEIRRLLARGDAGPHEWPEAHAASGLPFWFTHPERTPVDPSDLFIHLSRKCRYGGAILFSVLRHLALCEWLCRHLDAPQDHRAHVVAHDLHEAYIGDVITGLKRYLLDFADIEAGWEGHVHRSIDLTWPPSADVAASVRLVDLVALCAEMDTLGHAAAGAVAQKYGIVVTDPMRQAVRTICQLTDEQCWFNVCLAVPGLRTPRADGWLERGAYGEPDRPLWADPLLWNPPETT